MNNTDLEIKRQRIEKLVKIIGAGVIAFLVSPFIFATIKGAIGLVIAWAVGVAIVNFMPYFAMVAANWRLKAIKYEASKNPIETLENAYHERESALLQFRDNIKAFQAEVENFRSIVDDFKTKYPGVTTYDEKFIKMKELLVLRGKKYVKARADLKDFADIIERKRGEWKIVLATMAMDRAAGVGQDFESKLMVDTALDSVQTNLNFSFSELEVSLLDEQDPKLQAMKNITPAAALPAAAPAALMPADTSTPVELDHLGLDIDIGDHMEHVPAATVAPRRASRNH